jgi:nitrogen fixation/metabolism regulation signal transduction histidine kinase
MDAALLSDAFVHFANASRSLEISYALLQERIDHLSMELEKKNEELRRALDEAKESKDHLDAVLYNLEEAILVVDTEDRVTMCNRSAENLLSVNKAADLGKRYYELGFSLSREGSDVVLRVNGSKHTVMCSYSPVPGAGGGLRGKVVLIKDITRLRELETQHERNQRLISMGEMAAKIVHEIRNPLCSTELFATLLSRELESEEHRVLAAGISEGISHMNRILTNMLYFAKPHACRLVKTDLGGVVRDCLRLIAPTFHSREVTVECSLRPVEILGDAELLKQAFLNIVINAMQASSAGGSIKTDLREEDAFVVLSVSDQGEGIRPEDREKIFDPFFSTKDKGTGLGLAITSKIVQGHGGYIKVASEVGQGSTFSIYLPRGGSA